MPVHQLRHLRLVVLRLGWFGQFLIDVIQNGCLHFRLSLFLFCPVAQCGDDFQNPRHQVAAGLLDAFAVGLGQVPTSQQIKQGELIFAETLNRQLYGTDFN